MISEIATTQSYRFHGLRVRVCGEDDAPRLLHSRLATFVENTPARADVTAEFHSISAGQPHRVQPPTGTSRRIYESPQGEVLYYAETDQVYIDYDNRIRAICDPSRGRLSFSLVDSEENAWLASHPLFTICWIELLKRLQMFSIHASGVSRHGKCILLAGPSGSGKTTLALALLRAGFGFLGDDMLFLRSDADHVRVLSFPDETDVTRQTVEMFPELRAAAGLKGSAGRQKLAIRAETIYNATIAEESEPAVLVFPRIVTGMPAELRRIGAGEAALELSSNVLLTQRQASQSHLDVLGRLSRQAHCYRIDAERPDEVAAVLGALLGG